MSASSEAKKENEDSKSDKLVTSPKRVQNFTNENEETKSRASNRRKQSNRSNSLRQDSQQNLAKNNKEEIPCNVDDQKNDSDSDNSILELKQRKNVEAPEPDNEPCKFYAILLS